LLARLLRNGRLSGNYEDGEQIGDEARYEGRTGRQEYAAQPERHRVNVEILSEPSDYTGKHFIAVAPIKFFHQYILVKITRNMFLGF